MKNNIKTNLKLAAVCSAAAMTLSGCVKHESVIEDISSDKILVRDVTDDKEIIIECVSDPRYRGVWEQYLKYSQIGDTVVLRFSRYKYNNHNKYKCFTEGLDVDVGFNIELRHSRQEQAKFDSLKFVIAREHVGKQR